MAMSMSWLPSIPYAASRPEAGYWAPVTSTINWCEEDYYATLYSAEIVNTLTNVLFIAWGLKGIRSCIKYGHDPTFLFAFMGFCLVGLGSFLFHATLKYPMQLVDELSMIYTTCIMGYATFSYSKSSLFRRWLGSGLIVLAVFITLYYHYLQDPTFHQTCFGVLLASIIFRGIYIMERDLRPYLRNKYAPEASKMSNKDASATQSRPARRKDQEQMVQIWALVAMGMSIFVVGWAIWAADTAYCSRLRYWRRAMGLPWGMLLEGHGWWHCFTGIGSYFYITWGIWLRRCLDHEEEEYVLYWPSLWLSLPEVIPKTALAGAAGSEPTAQGYEVVAEEKLL